MISVRVACLCIFAILFGSVGAAPTPPTQPYHPAYGEIVHIAPAHIHGASGVGTGGNTPHPAIALGQDHQGYHIVAPISHNAADHLKPHMPVPATGMHGLTGHIQLDHMTAHPANIQRGHGRFGGRFVSGANTNAIEQAKSQVQAHNSAAHAHDGAAYAWRAKEASHSTASSQAFTHGDPAGGAWHNNQATTAGGNAAGHENAAASHRQDALNVNRYRASKAPHIAQSYNSATAAHQSLNNAAAYTAQGHHNYAAVETNNAIAHSAAAVGAANQSHP